MLKRVLKGTLFYSGVLAGGFIGTDYVLGVMYKKRKRTPDPNYDERLKIVRPDGTN
jgi:hypothetical protein